MKEGWTYKKLGEVATFINGDRSANYPSKKKIMLWRVFPLLMQVI